MFRRQGKWYMMMDRPLVLFEGDDDMSIYPIDYLVRNVWMAMRSDTTNVYPKTVDASNCIKVPRPIVQNKAHSLLSLC